MKYLPALILAIALVCPGPLLRADDASDRRAAAGELLDAMHMDRIIDQIKQNMLKMMDANPNASDETKQRMLTVFDNVLKWDTLKPDYVQAYREVYTEKELKDLTAFYKSPIGQKFLEKMPELQQRSMQIMQKRIASAMPQLQGSGGDQPAPPSSAPAPAPPQ